MNKQPSLTKSYFYNILSQTVNILYPLATIPYITRILGPEMLGKVNFAQSFVNYFITFANLGITTYAVREISKVRENKEELNKVFSELFSLIFMSTLISSLIYISLFTIIDKIKIDPYLYIILGFSLFLNQMAIGWLFFGIENFKYLSIRNIIFKIVIISLIFLLVRSQKDYLIYGFLVSLSIFGTNILDFTMALKYVNIKLSWQLFKHLKPLLILFLGGIFHVYSGIDVVMLGMIQENSDKAVGIFSTAKKILILTMSIIGSLINVNYSRSSYLLGQKNMKEYNEFFKKTLSFMSFISIFIATSVFLFSKDILMILGGEKFLEGEIVLKILSIVIVTSTFRYILESQVIIPNNKETVYIIGNTAGWIAMITICALAIPKYSYIGAGVGLLVGDAINLAIFILFATRILKSKPFTKEMLNHISLATIIVLIHTFLVTSFIVKESANLLTSILNIFALGSIYGLLYFFTLFLIKDPSTQLVFGKAMNILSKIVKTNQPTNL